MGLIKLASSVLGAAGAAANTTIGSAWVDYFESGDMSNGVLMKRGVKIVGPNSKNRGGDDNIITSGSGIDVQANQCMILVENGSIVDFCAEAGRYTYDSSLAPSLMSGSNKGLKALASAFGQSFLAGGNRVNTARVFYINLGEIQGFKWGSGNITFDHFERDLATDQPVWHTATNLMGNGVYSIQITDPAKFFQVLGAQKAGADGDGLITRADIEPQIKTEAIAAIRQGVGALSKLRIGYTDIASHEAELTQTVDEILDKSWDEARGISIFKIAIGMMDADDTSKQRISKYQEAKGFSDPSMLATYMGMGQTQAQIDAANNTAGAMTGLMGVGMMGGLPQGGANIADLMAQGQKPAAPQAAAPAPAPAPQAAGWTCPDCGTANSGNFCTNCGTARPAAPAVNNCGNCGYAFPDPANPPKFCPNCGTKVQ